MHTFSEPISSFVHLAKLTCVLYNLACFVTTFCTHDVSYVKYDTAVELIHGTDHTLFQIGGAFHQVLLQTKVEVDPKDLLMTTRHKATVAPYDFLAKALIIAKNRSKPQYATTLSNIRNHYCPLTGRLRSAAVAC